MHDSGGEPFVALKPQWLPSNRNKATSAVSASASAFSAASRTKDLQFELHRPPAGLSKGTAPCSLASAHGPTAAGQQRSSSSSSSGFFSNQDSNNNNNNSWKPQPPLQQQPVSPHSVAHAAPAQALSPSPRASQRDALDDSSFRPRAGGKLTPAPFSASNPTAAAAGGIPLLRSALLVLTADPDVQATVFTQHQLQQQHGSGGINSSNGSWAAAPASSPRSTQPPPRAGADDGLSQQHSAPYRPAPRSATPPPVSNGQQAAYEKVVFEKAFPSLGDSRHPLGYAPKQAPYKQTDFLSSRPAASWTSRLAEPEALPAPDPPLPQQQGSGEALGLSGQVELASGQQPRPAGGSWAGSQTRPTHSSSAVLAPAAMQPGFAQPQAAAPAASAHSVYRGSFAQAAGTASGGAGAGGAGSGAAGWAALGLTDQQLREQLAKKQSKQLIPVLARREEAGPAARGRQTLAGSGGASRLVGGHASAAGGKPHGLTAGAAVMPPPQPASALHSACSGSGMVCMKLTKKASHPLVKPLPPAAPVSLPAATAPCCQLPAAVQPQQQVSSGSVTAVAATSTLEQLLAKAPTPASAAVTSTTMSVPPAFDGVSAWSSQMQFPAYPSRCASPCLSPAPVAAQKQQELQQDEHLELQELASYLPGDLLGPAPDQDLLHITSSDLLGPAEKDSEQHQHQQLVDTLRSGINDWQQLSDGGGCGSGLPRLLEAPEAEEEAFLRSLGWTAAEEELSGGDGEDLALTEEEVAAFQAHALVRGGGGSGHRSLDPVADTHAGAGRTLSPALGSSAWGMGVDSAALRPLLYQQQQQPQQQGGLFRFGPGGAAAAGGGWQ